MLKKLLPAAAAVSLLILYVPAASAHEPRDVDDYNFVVGFMNEPAYEGLLNAVFLRVTKVAAHEHGDTAMSDAEAKEKAASESSAAHGHGDGHGHGHGGMSHAPLESEVPVSVRLMTEVEDGGGVNVHIMTDGWRWSPENVNGASAPGEGHAHIYVDGVKINRVYGPYYHLDGLEAGERHIRVTLNANSHADLTIDGEPLDAAMMVTVPEAGHHRAGHAPEPHEPPEPIEASAAMSLDVEAHEDPLGGYNLQVSPHGFTFAPQTIGGEYADGAGYAVVTIDGEEHARLYTDWLKLPALEPGMHTIGVRLMSNGHAPYSWRGEPVETSAAVRAEADSIEDAEDSGETDGHDHGEAQLVGVEGLENTLLVEVTHVPTGASQVMQLRGVRDTPGDYAAAFIPTASGQYTLRFFGSVEGFAIDELFKSGPGRFNDIEPADAIQFPESAASAREIEAALRGALEDAQTAQDTAIGVLNAADAAQSSASTAVTLAIAGIVVGALGIVVGGIGMVTAFRRAKN